MEPDPVSTAAINFDMAIARLAPKAKNILFKESDPCDINNFLLNPWLRGGWTFYETVKHSATVIPNAQRQWIENLYHSQEKCQEY